mgnify:CR=1 FL=1
MQLAVFGVEVTGFFVIESRLCEIIELIVAMTDGLINHSFGPGKFQYFFQHFDGFPEFSELDRKLGCQGKVIVQISLDETGKVTSVEANSGAKNLRGLAVDAVKKSKFNPVLVDGKPVKAEGTITFNFVAK